MNESNCSADIALLGGAVEDSILMPDPLPSANLLASTGTLTRSGSSTETSSHTSANAGSKSSVSYLSSVAEETPNRSQLRSCGTLGKLHAAHSSYNIKDDMEVFSPLVDVQPVTPSLDKLWENIGGSKKDNLSANRKPPLLFPSSGRRFPFTDDGAYNHSAVDWKPSATSTQVCSFIFFFCHFFFWLKKVLWFQTNCITFFFFFAS